MSVAETEESFTSLLTLAVPSLVRTGRGRPRHLSPRNQILVTLLWLRSYPCYSILSLLFDISVSSVSDTINEVWPILWDVLHPLIQWPDRQEWMSMTGIFKDIPSAVGCIDGTSHRIYRPETEDQRQFYSGHRSYHCFHTVVVITATKHFAYIGSGFLGHCNDARCLSLMPSVGDGQELDFPPDRYLLADLGYSNRYPLITPYRGDELNRDPEMLEQRLGQNRTIRAYRIYVEHMIGHLKTFRIMSELYRHPRRMQSSLVKLCAVLAKRRLDIFEGYV